MRGIFEKFIIFSLFLLLLSCKSTPVPPDWWTLEGTNFPLDRGASVYIFADVNEARQIIELIPLEILKDAQTRQMLDRTDYLAAAFSQQNNARHLYLQIAAWGNYPQFWVNAAFNSDRNWEKIQTDEGREYWYSKFSRLSISLDAKQAFMASFFSDEASLSPYAVSPFVEIPEGFNDFSGGAPLSLWLENPGPVFTRVLQSFGAPLNIPVQKLFINIYPAPSNSQGQYEALIRMHFESAVQARGTVSLLSLVSNLNLKEPFASIFFANPPVLNGNDIDIKTAVLGENEISLLLEMFLLYLN